MRLTVLSQSLRMVRRKLMHLAEDAETRREDHNPSQRVKNAWLFLRVSAFSARETVVGFCLSLCLASYLHSAESATAPSFIDPILAANGSKFRCADQSLQPLFDRLFNLGEESENGDVSVQRLLIRSPSQGPSMLAALIIGLKPRGKEGLEEFRRRHLVFAALRALAATRDHNLLVLCQDLVLRENHLPLLRATLIAAADLDPIMAGRLAVTLALPAAQHSPRGASDPLIRSMALGILAERCGGLATEDTRKAFAAAVTNGTFPEALQAMRLFPHALEAIPMAGLALDRTMEECKSGCADSKVPLFLQALETFDARQDPQRGMLLLKKLIGADRIYVSAVARAVAGGRLSLAPTEDIVAYAAKRLSEGSESEQDTWADLLLSWDPQRLVSLLSADDPRSIRARARLDRIQTPTPKAEKQ